VPESLPYGVWHGCRRSSATNGRCPLALSPARSATTRQRGLLQSSVGGQCGPRAMKRSARGRGLQVLSIALAALPFAFALIRAIETGGQDLRDIWVALAALGGATAVVAAAGLHRRRLNALAALFAAMFVSATLLALLAALSLGTILGARVLVVASAHDLDPGPGLPASRRGCRGQECGDGHRDTRQSVRIVGHEAILPAQLNR
jgi:hypothetical protein